MRTPEMVEGSQVIMFGDEQIGSYGDISIDPHSSFTVSVVSAGIVHVSLN